MIIIIAGVVIILVLIACKFYNGDIKANSHEWQYEKNMHHKKYNLHEKMIDKKINR